MPRIAFAASVSCFAIAAGLMGSLAVRGSGALAETAAGYPTVNTQLFDATPLGGEPRPLASADRTPRNSGADLTAKAQIFDPEVFGGVRSKFSEGRSVVGSSELGRSTIEGRSVGTPAQPAPAPVRNISPGQPRECESGSSVRRTEPQFGSLERNHAAG
jgi:hypothetical protein